METQQLSARLYAHGSPDVPPAETVRVFHRWIQTNAIDELLIDVVDYSHVHRGPGILLMTHEGEYGLGDRDGRLGLHYLRKRDEPGPLADKLREVLARLLTAAELLEQAFDGRMSFRGDELLVRVHNRLLAPSCAETLAAARAELDAVTAPLYGGTPATLARVDDAKQLFAVRATTRENPSLATLRARLA